MATAGMLRTLLGPTSLPPGLVEEVLADTNALWLLGERDDVVAGEIVLCHPPLEPGEVRAVVKGTDDPRAWRITVVTGDRPGLLAAAAGVLAGEDLTITGAAATVLTGDRLAVQRITVRAGPAPEATNRTAGRSAAWDQLGARLQETLGGGSVGTLDRRARLTWAARGPVTVSAHPQGSGRTMLQVEAPDSIGLLWAIASHLTSRGANIEAARLGGDDGVAHDAFIVVGPVDPAALTRALSGDDRLETASGLGRLLTAPLSLGAEGLRLAARGLGRLGRY